MERGKREEIKRDEENKGNQSDINLHSSSGCKPSFFTEDRPGMDAIKARNLLRAEKFS